MPVKGRSFYRFQDKEEKMNKQWVRLTLAIVLILAASGFGARHSAQAASASNDAVIQFGCVGLDCTYNPSQVVIQPGETVEWQGSFASHPLVSDDSLWTTVSAGNSFSHTFTMTGTFLFHCAFHGAPGGVGMAGRVIVRELPNKVYLPLILR